MVQWVLRKAEALNHRSWPLIIRTDSINKKTAYFFWFHDKFKSTEMNTDLGNNKTAFENSLIPKQNGESL